MKHKSDFWDSESISSVTYTKSLSLANFSGAVFTKVLLQNNSPNIQLMRFLLPKCRNMAQVLLIQFMRILPDLKNAHAKDKPFIVQQNFRSFQIYQKHFRCFLYLVQVKVSILSINKESYYSSHSCRMRFIYVRTAGQELNFARRTLFEGN